MKIQILQPVVLVSLLELKVSAEFFTDFIIFIFSIKLTELKKVFNRKKKERNANRIAQ